MVRRYQAEEYYALTIRQEVILAKINQSVKLHQPHVEELLTSLHSVFVSRLYFSGFSFLHLLQTRQRNTLLKVGSISIELHSWQRGFSLGSRKIAAREVNWHGSVLSGDERTRFQTLHRPLPFPLLLLRTQLLVYLLAIFDEEASFGIDHLR